MLEWEATLSCKILVPKIPANLTLYINIKGCKSKLAGLYFQGLTRNTERKTLLCYNLLIITIRIQKDTLSSHQIQTCAKSGCHSTDLLSASLLVASITLVTLSLQAMSIALIVSNSMTIKMVVVPPPSCLHTTDLLPTWRAVADV